ncbi:hypothetical protein TNCV_311801 [Trichonephila clavipes]|nr:hypothetical protein TNCV_311801 [Trichonephila clavipes]
MLDALCFLALALRFTLPSSLLPRSQTSCTCQLYMFLHLPRFPQVVFSVGIGLNSSKSDAADREDSVVTIDEPYAAITRHKLL